MVAANQNNPGQNVVFANGVNRTETCRTCLNVFFWGPSRKHGRSNQCCLQSSYRRDMGLACQVLLELFLSGLLRDPWGAFSSPCDGVVWDSINLSSHVSSPSRVVNWNDDGFVLPCVPSFIIFEFCNLTEQLNTNLHFGARKLAWLDSLSRWWEVGRFCVWFAPIFHGRCCWLRPQMMEPEVFSPAELGMEGAKLAAIRRRRHGKENPPVFSWIKAGCWQNGGKNRSDSLCWYWCIHTIHTIHFSPVLIDVFFQFEPETTDESQMKLQIVH